MVLLTTLGIKTEEESGIVLPHEHIFVDLRTWDQPGYAQAKADDVIALMAPELERASLSGITTIVDATCVGVGRRVDILKALSEANSFALVVPTGVYREPWIPEWIHEASEDELYEWMCHELEVEIEHTGVRAGWVKLSAGDNGMTEAEEKILRAATRAAQHSSAVIGSHTMRGRTVRDQLSIIQEAGYSPDHFIWIHAQIEPEFELNLEMAWRGAWVEYDSIGDEIYTEVIFDRILRMLEAGLGDQVLLSHDRGWYDPAKPGGGTPRPFNYLTETFLPRLRSAGVDENTIQLLTRQNPLRAFSRPG